MVWASFPQTEPQMFWLLRKLLIPVATFGFGMALQLQIDTDRCHAAGGIWWEGVCQGAIAD
jgi:1-acyl-sn-glycerol-3-phosphate acyltransferase